MQQQQHIPQEHLREEDPYYFPLTRLPKEILQRHVVAFLGPHDALNLSQCCKTLHNNVAVSVLRPSWEMFPPRGLQWTGSVDQGDTVRLGFRLFNVYNKNVRSHSVCFDCMWRDQGEGECKGEAWIKEYSLETNTYIRDVAHARLDSHERERLTMTFSPVQGMIYRFHYKVGGGGGHELFLTNGRLHSLIYDDQSRSLSKTFTALLGNGAIQKFMYFPNPTSSREHPRPAQPFVSATAAHRFMNRMLLATCQTLLRQISDTEERGIVASALQPLTGVVEEQFGIHLDASSLSAMETWLQQVANMESDWATSP